MKSQIIKTTILLIALISCFLITTNSYSCSAFALESETNDLAYGQTWDWAWKMECYIMTNSKNITKTAFMPWNDTPAKWTSKYNSLTFNGISKEHPFSGMNEKGLVIINMTLRGTKYSEIDSCPAIGELQWIQYQLDTSESLQEVINSEEKIRITKYSIRPLHFFVGDKKGETALIEFLNGKMVVYSGNSFPIHLATNSSYQDSINAVLKFLDFGNNDTFENVLKLPFDTDNNASLKRFIIGTYMLRNYKKSTSPIDYAKKVLKALNNEKYKTRMSVVFDPVNLKIDYWSYQKPLIKTASFKDFNFDSTTPLALNVNKDFNTIDTAIENYTQEINKKIVDYNTKNLPVSKEIKEKLVLYPSTIK